MNKKTTKKLSGWRFKGNELKYLKEVLDSDFKSSASGSMSKRFESLFAKKIGIKYVIASTSGTAALHQALAACEIGPGDEVIVPSLTVAMCGYAIYYAQAKPVFADIDKKTFLIDPDDIERKITSKTKAIMAVHLYGQMCDMDRIMAIAKKYNLRVIEDCAQCCLARDHRGRVSGTIGDIGCFSFGDTKMLSSGEGGAIVTNNKVLAVHIRKFGHLGFKNVLADGAAVRKDPMIFQDPKYIRHDTFSYNYIMSEPTAAIALAQVERVKYFRDLRIKMASLYRKSIGNCSWLIPQDKLDNDPSYWTFVALYKGEEELGVSWYEFRNKFIFFGGDKIRAAWALLYKEPAIYNLARTGKFFTDTNKKQGVWAIDKDWNQNCLNAEYMQPRLMQFTTNQRDIKEMKVQADALRKTIEYFNKNSKKKNEK
jgi:perosamine synthetase